MATLTLQITALLVAVTGTFASEYPCTISSKTLDCSNRGLTAPPAGLWPNFTGLYLNDNPITTFAKNAFTGFPGIYYFSAQRTSLVEIDLGDFVVMPKLQTLILQSNSIKTIIPAPEETTFGNLLSVMLYGNSLTTVDPNFLFNAPNVDVLSLNNNPLLVQPGEPVVNHDSLQTIYVGLGSNFADTDIAALLSGVPNISYVSLLGSHLTDITGAFVDLKKLTRVTLDNNSITKVTSNTFATDGALNWVELEGNPLQRFDTAAVNKPMGDEGKINIKDTPLACNCGFEGLFWWADARDITLYTQCGGVELCSFTRRRSPASPAHNQNVEEVDHLGRYVGGAS